MIQRRKTAVGMMASLALACGGAASGPGDTEGEVAAGVPAAVVAAASSGFVGATASAGTAADCPALNAIDGSFSTRWTALGKGQYLTGDMGDFKTVTGLSIAWYRGAVRKSSFQIQARAADGTVTTVYSGQSSGKTEGLEAYTFAPVSTRYVRVVVNGNTENDYANIWEMRVSTAATPAPAVAVSVSPTTATAAPGGSQQFASAVTGTANTGVVWTVQEGSAGGAVGSAGLYTAPSGAGTYHVVATSVADPTKSAAATVTVTAPGVTVAAPNGSDDTASFNSAITAANGGTVNVQGSGTYMVRAVAVNKANTTLACDAGAPATLKLKALASGDGSPILKVTAGNFTIRNCILDGNKTAQPAGGFNDSFMGRSFRTALLMDGPLSGLTVDKATFKNVYGAGIATRTVSQISITNSAFQDNNFEAAFATTSWVSGDPTDRVTGFKFVGNTITDARSHDPSINANGLLVQQTATVDIENNVWDGFERNAMKLENCRDGTVANNRISNGDQQNFAGIGMQNGAHAITLSGNQIDNTGSGIDTSLVVGGQFGSDTVDHVTITGNTITNVKAGSMPDGIRLLGYGSAMTDISITGNVIKSVPRDGINVRQFTTYYASPAFARITIQNNQLTSAGSCTNWFSGTSVQPTSATSTPNTCN
jgi:hypothetical protein